MSCCTAQLNLYSYLLGSTLVDCSCSTVALGNCHSGSVAVVMSGDMVGDGMEDMEVVRMKVDSRTKFDSRTSLLMRPRNCNTVGVVGLQSLLPDDRP